MRVVSAMCRLTGRGEEDVPEYAGYIEGTRECDKQWVLCNALHAVRRTIGDGMRNIGSRKKNYLFK